MATSDERSTAGMPSHQFTAGTPPHQSAAGTSSYRRCVYWLGGVVLVAGAVLLSSCRSKDCARMLSCCQAVKEVEGIGDACGPKATGVDDPKTCQTILETIGYMYEKRDEELPEACRYDAR